VTTKTCIKCGEAKALDAFGRRTQSCDGLRGECKACMATYKKARYVAGRVCTRCYRTLSKGEASRGRRCDGCTLVSGLSNFTSGLPQAVGRPGCIVAGGVCRVLDEPGERWVEMPVVNCKTCGLDQHLPECLDCTAPVGQGDKQKSIRPLRHCVDCGDWTPNSRCSMCSV